jgi:hypothetical protein
MTRSPTPVHILAIDPGRKMGLARWRSDTGEEWTQVLHLDYSDPGRRYAAAAAAIRGKVDFFASFAPITHAFCEAIYIDRRKPAGVIAVAEMQGVIKGICAELDIPLHLVEADVWRKSFGVRGGGRDDKKASSLRVARMLGYDPKDDNEADVTGILWHARGQLDPTSLWRKRA